METARAVLGNVTNVVNTPSVPVPTGAGLFNTAIVVIMAIALIVVGALSTMTYNACSVDGKRSANINHYAATVAIGLGVGLVSYIALQQLFDWVDTLPLILLSMGAIAVGAINVGLRNANKEDVAQVFNTAILGVGLGLLIGFGLLLIKFIPAPLRVQIIGLVIALAVSVFSIFGINTYQKCEKPAKARTPLVILGILLAVGLLAAIGFVAAFII